MSFSYKMNLICLQSRTQ